MKSWTRAATIVALLLAAAATGWRWRHDRGAAGLDFYNFWVAGQLVGRDDVSNLYSAETQERIGEEFYERGQRSGSEIHRYDAQRRRRLFLTATPFLYACFAWVSPDYVESLTIYRATSLGAFVIGVLLIGWVVRLPAWGPLLLVSALLVMYRPLEADLRVANVNCVQLLMIAAIIALGSRESRAASFSAGVVAAVAICFKPNVAFIVPLIVAARIRRGDWPRLAAELAGGATGAFAAIAVASASFEGLPVWQHWLGSAQGLWELLPDARARNIAPALPLFQRFGPAAGYALFAILLAILIAADRRRERSDANLVGAGLLVYLLGATVVWLHYLVLAVPAAIVAMRRRAFVLPAIVALLLMAEEPFERLTRMSAQPYEVPMIAAALGILFALSLRPASAFHTRGTAWPPAGSSPGTPDSSCSGRPLPASSPPSQSERR